MACVTGLSHLLLHYCQDQAANAPRRGQNEYDRRPKLSFVDAGGFGTFLCNQPCKLYRASANRQLTWAARAPSLTAWHSTAQHGTSGAPDPTVEGIALPRRHGGDWGRVGFGGARTAAHVGLAHEARSALAGTVQSDKKRVKGVRWQRLWIEAA